MDAILAAADQRTWLGVMWLSYRCFVAKGQDAIPLFGRFGVAAQIGTAEYIRPRRPRQRIEEWLERPAPALVS